MKELISITAYNSQGEGVGRSSNGQVYFVEAAIVGENVSVATVESSSKFRRAKIDSISTPSPSRVSPPCPYFAQCGGCALMHMDAKEQRRAKQELVLETLKRIGSIEPKNFLPIYSPPLSLSYRTKATFHIRGDAIGYFKKRSHELLPIETCKIFNEQGNHLFQKIRKKLPPGVSRLTIRSAETTQDFGLLLEGAKAPSKKLKDWCHQVPCSVVYQNSKKTTPLKGIPYIVENLNGLSFQIPLNGFFQIYPTAAFHLFSTALSWLSLKSDMKVIDAHCGVGVLALLVAPKVQTVLGFEPIPDAIECAKKNALTNSISNTNFECCLAEQRISKLSKADLVILNPPRGGCQKNLLKSLKSNQILYISCAPATLARDLKLLKENYLIETVQAFDLFPQTHHVETAVLLKIKPT